MFDEEKPPNIGTYVVMLIQTSEKFEEKFSDKIPSSNYERV